MRTNLHESATLGHTEPITLIGLDCDDPSALTKLLKRQPFLFESADIICGGKTILSVLKTDPELSGRLLPLSPPLEPLFESLAGLYAQGLKIVVLADGDPLFFGIGASLTRRMKAGSLRVIPAISSLQAACARLCLPWHNVYCLSLHGRNDLAPLYDAISSKRPICILTGGRATPDGLANLLLDRGADWFEVHTFENMGSKNELVRSMSLKECGKNFFGDCVTMILNPVLPPRSPGIGLNEQRLWGNYTTKRPIRGAIMELLRVEPHNTVWDVGAGSGVMALEICAVAHAGKVIAVEHKASRCLDIQENRRIFAAVNLDIAMGHAPEILENLARPDRIFLGGGFSGADAPQLLDKCVNSLPRGGRLVASCILLNSFMSCHQFLEKLGWPMEVMQIHASNALPLGAGQHFSPLNPIFLLATQKP